MDEKGNVVARPMMYLALTYDHRLIDGREGVTFLKSVADRLLIRRGWSLISKRDREGDKTRKCVVLFCEYVLC